MAVVQDVFGPGVTLTWTYSGTPLLFLLRQDGIMMRSFLPSSVKVPNVANTYSHTFWNMRNGESHHLEISAMAVVGNAIRESKTNADVWVRVNIKGKWLIDTTPGQQVPVFLGDAQDTSFDIGETATVYNPVGGRKPVRISDSVRGYEGTITGTLLNSGWRDQLLKLVGRRREVRYMNSSLNFPCRIGQVSVGAAAVGDLWPCSIELFQTGEFFAARGWS